MGYKILELVTYFIIYSILGWMLESAYRSVCEKKIINTGFLFGPMCPIYGSACVIMYITLSQFAGNIVLLFIISFLGLSIWEYLVGVFLELVFHTKYWDYSDHKINIKGRVCLSNSMYWGILGILFIKYIHPFIQGKVEMYFTNQIFQIVIIIIFITFLVDTIVSVVKTKQIAKALQKVEEINKQIKEKLEEIKNVKGKELTEDAIESLQNTIDVLKIKKARIFRRLYKRVYRLKKAFPAIQSKEITEILNRKVEAINKKKERIKEKAINETNKKKEQIAKKIDKYKKK